MPEHLAQGSTEPPLSPGKLRLYGMRFCPYDQRVHLVLIAKNIPHDNVFINLASKPDWYLKRIPSTKVPGLVIEGEGLYESLIVADFLDDKYSERPLHSKDPLQKAKDRIFLENCNKALQAFYKPVRSTTSPEEEVANLITELTIFEDEFTKRKSKFFGGEEPGMVDYMVWPWFERLAGLELIFGNKLQLPESEFPQLVSWMKTMKEDKVVKKYLLSADIHAKFLRSLMTGTPDYSIPC